MPGQRAGHVFLQRNLAFEGVIPGQVDDAEAAAAEQAPDLELGHARARRQCLGGVGRQLRRLGLGHAIKLT